MKTLVTKLFEDVNDSSLPILGAIKLHRVYNPALEASNSTLLLQMSNVEGVKANIVNVTEGIGCFASDKYSLDTDNGITEFSLHRKNNNVLYLADGTYDVIVSPKYNNFVYFQARYVDIAGDLKSLAKAFNETEPIQIDLSHSNIVGDLSCLKSYNVTKLNIESTPITGKLESCTRFVNFTGLMNFKGTGVTGSMRGMCEGLKANGMKNKTFQFAPNDNITDLVGTLQDGVYNVVFDDNGNFS